MSVLPTMNEKYLLMVEPDLDIIRAAAERIAPYIHRTPVMTSEAVDALCGASVFFKCENLQKAGAFKIRGATNAVLSLPHESAARGVATHSSGNHGAALALAARRRGIPAYVVMPRTAPAIKRAAVAGYGAEILSCEPTMAAREAQLTAAVERTGATFVPPYNDYAVMAGQGTAALELCEQVPDLDAVVTPVGGGGLLAGTAIAVAGVAPAAAVYGAEPEGADDAWRSLRAGSIQPMAHPDTIADGLRSTLGALTFPVMQARVRDVVTVSDEATIAAMRHVWERMKIIIEPSAAVAVAAVMKGDAFRGRRVGVILSGGNVDLDRLPWM